MGSASQPKIRSASSRFLSGCMDRNLTAQGLACLLSARLWSAWGDVWASNRMSAKVACSGSNCRKETEGMSRPLLLIEDDEDDVFFMKRAMQQAGVHNPVSVARDGREAIEW